MGISASFTGPMKKKLTRPYGESSGSRESPTERWVLVDLGRPVAGVVVKLHDEEYYSASWSPLANVERKIYMVTFNILM